MLMAKICVSDHPEPAGHGAGQTRDRVVVAGDDPAADLHDAAELDRRGCDGPGLFAAEKQEPDEDYEEGIPSAAESDRMAVLRDLGECTLDVSDRRFSLPDAIGRGQDDWGRLPRCEVLSRDRPASDALLGLRPWEVREELLDRLRRRRERLPPLRGAPGLEAGPVPLELR